MAVGESLYHEWSKSRADDCATLSLIFLAELPQGRGIMTVGSVPST
jgi:hypothetical protein